MRENGSMISIMEKELNNGISIRLNILEIFLMDKKQERENLSLMEMFMKVILLMDSSMEKEYIHLQDLVKFMKVIL